MPDTPSTAGGPFIGIDSCKDGELFRTAEHGRTLTNGKNVKQIMDEASTVNVRPMRTHAATNATKTL